MRRRALPVMPESPPRREISYRLRRFSGEHVSHPSHSPDKRVAAFELSAQMADMDIESAVIRSGLPFEQRFGDLVSRHDPACESDQQAQDLELERREFDRMSRPPNFPSLKIHLNVTEQFHRVGAVLQPARTTQDC